MALAALVLVWIIGVTAATRVMWLDGCALGEHPSWFAYLPGALVGWPIVIGFMVGDVLWESAKRPSGAR